MQILHFYVHTSNLISHKIWVIAKLKNFHTVCCNLLTLPVFVKEMQSQFLPYMPEEMLNLQCLTTKICENKNMNSPFQYFLFRILLNTYQKMLIFCKNTKVKMCQWAPGWHLWKSIGFTIPGSIPNSAPEVATTST